MSGTAPPIELMRTLDEKFLVDDAVFVTQQPTGTLFIEAAALRLPDGTLDAALIRRTVLGGAHMLPALRQRLRPMPLAITTPAWVPVDEVAAGHVAVEREPDAAKHIGVFTGTRNPPLHRTEPLWSVLVCDLGDDTVSLTLRMSHALGDGMFGTRVLDAFTATDPFDRADDALPRLAAPATGVGVLLTVGRAWWGEFAPLPSAWSEYWRKPFRRRLRRWAGRARRQLLGAPGVDASSPQLHHRLIRLDAKAVRQSARSVGISLHNHLVAAALAALLQVGTAPRTALEVPLSKRTGRAGAQRNHIVMTTVAGSRETAVGDLTGAVDAAITAAVAGEPAPPEPGVPSVGYASYLPWQMRRRWFGRAEVTGAVLWPVLAAGQRIAVFGSSYADGFSLAVTGRDEAEVGAVADLVAALLVRGER